MSRRYLVVALASVLALATVAPTLAQDQSQAGQLAKGVFAKKTAKQAKRIAKQARSLARAVDRKATSAKNRANKARTAADGASQQAATASQQAGAVEQELNRQRAETAVAAGTVSTAEESDFVDLGGPQVTVTVPQSGLIEVWAQVAIADGAVSIYEDGEQLPGQDPNGVCDGPSGTLLSFPSVPEFVTSTPGSFSFIGCGGSSAPGPALFETTPGQHTYELRYADCGCDAADAEFSDRTLRVAPRP